MKNTLIKFWCWANTDRGMMIILGITALISSLHYQSIINDYKAQLELYEKANNSYVKANQTWEEFATKHLCKTKNKSTEEIEKFCQFQKNTFTLD